MSASQDADLVRGKHSGEYFALSDAERRAKGIPKIDTNIYARENGWAIYGLTSLYSVTGERATLTEAERAARWILAHRGLKEGGFSHGDNDAGVLYLADNLAMLQALLSLYQVSGERSWLLEALKTGTFIDSHFFDSQPGALSSASESKSILSPVRLTDQNIELARTVNLLFQYTGQENLKKMAERIERYVSDPSIALEYRSEPGVLLVQEELNRDPLHLTVIAPKEDAAGREIFLAGLKYFSRYKRIEWWDRKEGELPRADVGYPELPGAAGFICTEKRCSLPLSNGAELVSIIERFRILK